MKTLKNYPADLERGPWSEFCHPSYTSGGGLTRTNIIFFDGSSAHHGHCDNPGFVGSFLEKDPREADVPAGMSLAEMFIRHAREGVEPDWNAIRARVETSPFYIRMRRDQALREAAIASVVSVETATCPAVYVYGRDRWPSTLTIFRITSRNGSVVYLGKTDVGVDQVHRELGSDSPFLKQDLRWETAGPWSPLTEAINPTLERFAAQ